MAKTATVDAAQDPVAARIAVLDRVRSRRPGDRVQTYANVDGRGHDLTVRTPSDSDRLPPADLGQWVDDRVIGAFGGRTGLNPLERRAFSVLEAMRSGSPDAVRTAVRDADEGLADDLDQRHKNDDQRYKNLLCGTLAGWRSQAPAFAYGVTAAAVAEARDLGWEQLPRRARRRLAEAEMADA